MSTRGRFEVRVAAALAVLGFGCNGLTGIGDLHEKDVAAADSGPAPSGPTCPGVPGDRCPASQLCCMNLSDGGPPLSFRCAPDGVAQAQCSGSYACAADDECPSDRICCAGRGTNESLFFSSSSCGLPGTCDDPFNAPRVCRKTRGCEAGACEDVENSYIATCR